MSNNVDLSTYILKQFGNIKSPQDDKRLYRGFELTNQLKLLLISDPTTEKSAVALDVNTG